MKNLKEVRERFWGMVKKTSGGCWNWQGGQSLSGHGRFKIDGKLHSPHRVIYEWIHGKVGPKTEICHTCDNPQCVNPSHLFAGTKSDNMKDAYQKGRLKVGGKLVKPPKKKMLTKVK